MKMSLMVLGLSLVMTSACGSKSSNKDAPATSDNPTPPATPDNPAPVVPVPDDQKGPVKFLNAAGENVPVFVRGDLVGSWDAKPENELKFNETTACYEGTGLAVAGENIFKVASEDWTHVNIGSNPVLNDGTVKLGEVFEASGRIALPTDNLEEIKQKPDTSNLKINLPSETQLTFAICFPDKDLNKVTLLVNKK